MSLVLNCILHNFAIERCCRMFWVSSREWFCWRASVRFKFFALQTGQASWIYFWTRTITQGHNQHLPFVLHKVSVSRPGQRWPDARFKPFQHEEMLLGSLWSTLLAEVLQDAQQPAAAGLKVRLGNLLVASPTKWGAKWGAQMRFSTSWSLCQESSNITIRISPKMKLSVLNTRWYGPNWTPHKMKGPMW